MIEPVIVSDPAIMAGKPCFHGSRITVEIVLRYLAAGARPDDVLAAFPGLGEAHVRAALEYAAQLAGQARPAA
jgi:uncharacterized protein (DUF433 family)